MRGTTLTQLCAASGSVVSYPAKAGLLAAMLLCPCLCALAHEAPASWTYPPACCHGDAEHGECQSIPARTVHVRPDGWSVVLFPGDHRKVTRPRRYFIPYGDEIPSGDGDYHICLHPTEDHENCFFVPPDST